MGKCYCILSTPKPPAEIYCILRLSIQVYMDTYISDPTVENNLSSIHYFLPLFFKEFS